MNNLPQIMQVTPHVSETIWGGRRLKELKNLTNYPEDSLIGETWEVSDLQQGQAKCNGINLTEIFSKNKKYFIGKHSALSYLIKFIDTKDNLSVQVHPDDQYARSHENSSGKTECWIILDSKPGCGIYLGLKDGVTREHFEKSLLNKEDMSQLLKFHPTKRGDFFFVPSRTIHAIGHDVTLVEIQQSSGITYRVWDWNRVDKNGKSRELHVKQAMEVIDFSPEKNKVETFKHSTDILDNANTSNVIEHYDFVVEKYTLSDKVNITLSTLPARAKSIICLEGKIKVSRGGENMTIDSYHTLLLPLEGENSITVSGNHNSIFLLVS